MSVSAVANDRPPTLAELPTHCKDAGQSIVDRYQGGMFAKDFIHGLDNDGLQTFFSSPEVVGLLDGAAYIVYNSTDLKTSEYVTRFIFREIGYRLGVKHDASLLQLDSTFLALRELATVAATHSSEIPITPLDQMIPNEQPGGCPLVPDHAVLTRVCRLLPFLGACQTTTEALLTYASPKSMFGSCYSAGLSWYKYASDPTLTRGLGLYLLRVLPRIQATLASTPLRVRHNAFDELVESFRQSGMNHIQANRSALLVLGVYGIRGAEYLSDIPTEAFAGRFMQVFQAVISHLDHVQMAEGLGSYALPGAFWGQCPYGKPYHFWLAAHIAALGAQSHYPTATSAVMAGMIGVGYELFGTNRDMSIIDTPQFGPLLDQARLDSFFDLLGGHFGAVMAEQTWMTPKNIDALLEHEFRASGKISKLERDLLKPYFPDGAYFQWLNLVAPQSLMIPMFMEFGFR